MARPAEGLVLQLEELYCRYGTSAVDWAERRFGDRGLAEDAVQEAFMQLFARAVRGGSVPISGGAAMVRKGTQWAAHNLLDRAHSSQVREQHHAVVGLDEDSAWVQLDARSMLATICASLSHCHRQILHLYYVQGLSDSECAQHLGINIKAARSRRRRAIEEARKSSRSKELTLVATVM